MDNSTSASSFANAPSTRVSLAETLTNDWYIRIKASFLLESSSISTSNLTIQVSDLEQKVEILHNRLKKQLGLEEIKLLPGRFVDGENGGNEKTKNEEKHTTNWLLALPTMSPTQISSARKLTRSWESELPQTTQIQARFTKRELLSQHLIPEPDDLPLEVFPTGTSESEGRKLGSKVGAGRGMEERRSGESFGKIKGSNPAQIRKQFLLHAMGSSPSTQNSTNSSSSSSSPPSSKGGKKLRPPKAVLSQLKHDPAFDVEEYVIGIIDREKGIVEMKVEEWREFQEQELIAYFRNAIRDEIVWDRARKVDLLGGSRVRVETPGLCKLCQPVVSDIVCGQPLPRERWKEKNVTSYSALRANAHYSATMLLKDSATRGCELCQFLMGCFGERIPLQYQLVAGSPGGWGCGRVEVERCWREGEKFGSTYLAYGGTDSISISFFERYTVEELSSSDEINWDATHKENSENRPRRERCNNTEKSPRMRKRASADPRDSISLALAARWLHDCVEKHEKCARRPSPLLPTRVIDVTADGSDPLLYITNGRSGNYVALSYCWGKDQTCKTVKDNITARQKSIPLSILPQTLQDAITVTRALKCRFLWIDALCIVQDDPADWEREAGRMRHVYENSLLTISATASSDSNEGFLNHHSPLSERDLGRLQKSDRSWHLRGWTFQERILPRAVLHYMADEMMWECNSACMGESKPGQGFPSSVKRDLIETIQLHGADSFHVWSQLVTDYAYRALTCPQDRLVAISGLAQKHKRGLKDEYLAGLWKNDMPRALLWTVPPPFSTKAAMYVAPSWSWASMGDGDRGVHWDQNLINLQEIKFPDLVFEIEDCHIEESLPGSCGAVTGGHIEVRGLVINAKWTDLGDTAKLDTELGEFQSTAMDEEQESPQRCWALLVGVWPTDDMDSEDEDAYDRKKRDLGTIWALVLGKPKASASTQPREEDFVRIGIAQRFVEYAHGLEFGGIGERRVRLF
ncbi:hypothetical protein EG329_005931 [Mollisiaceae sp. DMI_Dod_QoI]|nr:hypothetical protein EG329_005931 [Helotiales sp. DMI_Dod_QoI]